MDNTVKLVDEKIFINDKEFKDYIDGYSFNKKENKNLIYVVGKKQEFKSYLQSFKKELNEGKELLVLIDYYPNPDELLEACSNNLISACFSYLSQSKLHKVKASNYQKLTLNIPNEKEINEIAMLWRDFFVNIDNLKPQDRIVRSNDIHINKASDIYSKVKNYIIKQNNKIIAQADFMDSYPDPIFSGHKCCPVSLIIDQNINKDIRKDIHAQFFNICAEQTSTIYALSMASNPKSINNLKRNNFNARAVLFKKVKI